MTKKSIWIDFASLVLGAMLITVTVPNTWAAVGDGTGFNSEVGKYCANKTPCEPSGCFAWGLSFVECSTIRSTGICKNSSFFNPGPCASFSTYICAEGKAYASRDANNICSNYMHDVVGVISNGCI
jgi:hypothetical protein